jgi:hypothetical protein
VPRCGFELPECGDPNGEFGVWENVTVPFSGVAKSLGSAFLPPPVFAATVLVDDVVIALAPTQPPTSPPAKRPTKFPTKRPTKSPTKHPARSATKACRKGMKADKRCMKTKNPKAM